MDILTLKYTDIEWTHSKKPLLNTIKMAVLLGHNETARYVFNDAMQLSREETIEECINLALKKGSIFLASDLEIMKNEKILNKY